MTSFRHASSKLVPLIRSGSKVNDACIPGVANSKSLIRELGASARTTATWAAWTEDQFCTVMVRDSDADGGHVYVGLNLVESNYYHSRLDKCM